jgi:hypothetical protein
MSRLEVEGTEMTEMVRGEEENADRDVETGEARERRTANSGGVDLCQFLCYILSFVFVVVMIVEVVQKAGQTEQNVPAWNSTYVNQTEWITNTTGVVLWNETFYNQAN